MTIDNKFIFSQSSLQDYLDCPRRFELKYIKKIKWPAQQFFDEEDYRYFIDLGNKFHRFVHQYFIGISPKHIRLQIKEPQLLDWWESFLSLGLDYAPSTCIPEMILGGSIANRIVIGKFDLVMLQKDKITIYDWKTSKKTPHNLDMLDRIQTKLYLHLLTKNGAHVLNYQEILPDQIEMVYWFTSNPDNPIVVHFDEHQFIDNARHLHELVDEIIQITPGNFKLTNKHRFCKYCQFRSICDRGTEPGQWDQEAEFNIEDQIDSALNSFQSELDQISETWL